MRECPFFYASNFPEFVNFVRSMKIFSDISLWWLLPIVAIAVVASVFYYRNQQQLADASKGQKKVLVALRAVIISLLLLFLLGIIVENKEYKTEKPVFITLVDNSSSMLNYKDSADVKKKLNALTNGIKEKYKERFDFKEYVVGTDVSGKRIDFSEGESNLDAGFEFIYSQFYNRNIGGICFVSDGNYTTGKSPVYSARKINLTPVFSIGIGDTVVKRDQLVKAVSANQVAFYKNDFPIEVDIEARKMGKGKSTVRLFKGEREIGQQTVDFTDGKLDFAHVNFLVNADEIGFVRYSVRIENKQNEITYENNIRTFYIEVIDSRTKVLILAKAPHPDLTSIHSVFEQDENTEAEIKLVSDWNGSLKDYALLVWHNPGADQTIINQIKTHKTPVLYMLTSQAKGSDANALNIGMKLSSRNGIDEVQAELNTQFQLFELSDELKRSLQLWPPLKVPFGKIEVNTGNTLISQRIGQVKKTDPILYFGGDMNRKYGVIIGEGLWKWKLMEFAKTQKTTSYTELIQRTTQYLTVKNNTDPFRVILPKRFNKNDEIVLKAEYYNASLERITTAKVKFELKNEENKVIPYEFAKSTLDYTLSLGKLKPGKYTWNASATLNGKTSKKSGVFVVEDISIEILSTHANHGLLKQIANETSGKFYTLSKSEQLIRDLENRKDIVNIQYEESNFNDLIDWKWLFALLVLLLGGEWFLRRYWGTY